MKHLTLFIFLLTQSCQTTWTDEILSIQAGMCLGNCPVYSIKLQSDGSFELIRNKSIEPIYGFLDQEKLIELHRLVSEIDFENSKKQYGDLLIRDLPKIKIIFGDNKIIFVGRHSAFESYLKLIQWSDELIKCPP
jgi:hypothetical protein